MSDTTDSMILMTYCHKLLMALLGNDLLMTLLGNNLQNYVSANVCLNELMKCITIAEDSRGYNCKYVVK